MKITTSYTVPIKDQLILEGRGAKEKVTGYRQVDDRLMKETASVCLDALKCCADIWLKEWDTLSSIPTKQEKGKISRKRAADIMIHSTVDSKASYPEFDRNFPFMPAYTRRSVIADSLGLVSSYCSNRANWKKMKPDERGEEPKMGFPDRYELTFYDQERKTCDLDKGIIGLKLYNGKEWGWYYFRIKPSDAKHISKLKETRKMLSPVVEKVKGRYQIRFSFQETRDLVSDEEPLGYRILSVDLGINAPASWCVMEADGTVRDRGVIHLTCEEDRLRHMINRKRMYQQAGKRSKSVYRMVRNANERLSVDTCREIMKIAVLYNVDCIVFEHLDRKGKVMGRKYRERIHLWRANDIQKRVELQAHRHGMRISRVCAWGTSKLAFDGSGSVLRGEKAGLSTYSMCRFQNGKIYNCDLSAALNIGARYFLREYAKRKGCPTLPKTPQRTYADLVQLVHSMAA